MAAFYLGFVSTSRFFVPVTPQPGTLRRGMLRRKALSSENRSSWRKDMSLFLELEEELGLFGKITLSFLCPGNGGGVAHILSTGAEFLALMLASFRKFEFVQKGKLASPENR
jgi:hypothetical protein